jgi:hypothetical protein
MSASPSMRIHEFQLAIIGCIHLHCRIWKNALANALSSSMIATDAAMQRVHDFHPKTRLESARCLFSASFSVQYMVNNLPKTQGW